MAAALRPFLPPEVGAGQPFSTHAGQKSEPDRGVDGGDAAVAAGSGDPALSQRRPRHPTAAWINKPTTSEEASHQNQARSVSPGLTGPGEDDPNAARMRLEMIEQRQAELRHTAPAIEKRAQRAVDRMRAKNLRAE